MQCSVILQQRVENAQQKTSLRATSGFISESWDWQRWLRLVSSPRQFPCCLLSSFLFPGLACHCAQTVIPCITPRDRGAHQTVKSVAFLLPSPHLLPVMRSLSVRPWSDNVAFFSTNFQDISPPGWMRGSVWPNAREGFDETPIDPLGSKRQLMGGWNAIIAIHQPLQN